MATDPTQFSPPPRRSTPRSLILFTLIAFLAGIAIALALVRYYAGWVSPAPGTAAQQSAGGPAAMFQPPPEADATQRAPDAMQLEARLDALAGHLQQIEARQAMVDLDSRAAAGNAGRAEALLIAFAARRAVDRGLALGYLEGQLRARFGAVQPRAVQAIIDTARMPVTVEDLRQSLDTIAPELATGGLQGGWWDSLHREITGLIVLRKEGTPSPRPADRLQRIRRLLDARQVEAALAEVARMPGAAQAGAWTAAAQRFVDAHRALDLIETVAILGPGAQDAEALTPQRIGQAAPAAAQPAALPAAAAPAAPRQSTQRTPAAEAPAH